MIYCKTLNKIKKKNTLTIKKHFKILISNLIVMKSIKYFFFGKSARITKNATQNYNTLPIIFYITKLKEYIIIGMLFWY